MRIFHRILAATLAASVSARANALTAEDASQGFIKAVTAYCAPALLQGVALDRITNASKEISPASEKARRIVTEHNGQPIWTVAPGTDIVLAYQPGANVCDVVAYGPPVGEIFQRTALVLEDSSLGFSEVPAPASPNAIQRSFQKEVGSGHLVIKLIGSNPGMPGHTFPFSLFKAYLSMEPATP